MSDEALLRLTAGRARASEQAPYFSTALFALQPVAVPGLGSYAVDRHWRLYWDPEFCTSMTVDEGAAVWLHEVGHLLREHGERFDALLEPDERRRHWNRAADAAINADLREAGIVLPPVKAVFPEQIAGATREMSTEQLYRLLPAGPGGRPAGTPGGPAGQPPALVLHPAELLAGDLPAATVLARLRDPAAPGPRRTVLLDAVGAELPAARDAEERDARSVSLTVAAALPGGRYTVALTRGGPTVRAGLTVALPRMRLRPDRLDDAAVPVRVVAETDDVPATADTVVELLDADGEPLPGALTGTGPTGGRYLACVVGPLPDGLYAVRVTTGRHVATALLTVGLPRLESVPAELPSGFAAPQPLRGLGEGLPVDDSTTVSLAGPDGSVPGALGEPAAGSPSAVDTELRQSLPDGQYALTVTTGDRTGVAVLTVGGSGSGSGSGSGDAGAEGPGTPADGGGDDDGDAGGAAADCGSGAGGARRPWEREAAPDDGSVGAGRAERLRQDAAREIARHAADPETRGTVPGGWLRWADAVLHPRVDWREELDAVVRRTAAHVAGRRDYTYARPSRRASAVPGVVLPALRSPRPPTATVVLDTSGSMRDEDLAQCLAEVDAILRRVHGEPVTVIACDASAADAQVVRSVERLELAGGGGTDLRVGIAAAASRRPAADLVITLTDGWTPWPEAVPAANPRARYVAVLVGGRAVQQPPAWVHTLVVEPGPGRSV